jgi:hypothetical protein
MVVKGGCQSTCIVGRRLPADQISGNERPCRDAGVGEIALGLAMLKRANRASHIDPPASSNAIMRRARPYCGENPEPGKDVTESLTPRPELENDQDPKRTLVAASRKPDPRLLGIVSFVSVVGYTRFTCNRPKE